MMLEDGESLTSDGPTSMIDPLIQYDEGHDHRNASQHIFYTDNIQPVSFNPLTAPGMPKYKSPILRMAEPMHTLPDGQKCILSM